MLKIELNLKKKKKFINAYEKAWKEKGEALIREKKEEEQEQEQEKEREKEKEKEKNGDISPNAATTEREVLVNGEEKKPLAKSRVGSVSMTMYSDDKVDDKKWATSWWTQFQVLAYRAYRHRRGNILTPSRIIEVTSL
ncbi:hypothetical protein RFI_39683, partial [Reticulomyxa filosa]